MATTSTTLPYFLYSSGILLREGLEALLVIIALIAATRHTGRRELVRGVYFGAGAAVAVSLCIAWAVQHVIGDNTSDTLEGVFQLFAAATLFYVSSWMTARGQARRWRSFIDTKVEAVRRSDGPAFALGMTAFLAVLREGAETIVFFQALMAGATETVERHAIVYGLLAGAVALTLTFLILRRVTFIVPLGPVFAVTSVMLYGLAVIFAGQGIASFQESGLIGAVFVPAVPTMPMLGLYPTVQTLAAQGVLLIMAVAALGRPWMRRPAASRVTGSTQTAPQSL